MTPVDPWAGHTAEVPIVHRPGGRRPLYGFVYALQLRGWSNPRLPYIGKTKGSSPTAVNTRVHGRSGSAHTSPASIAKDPWKADILPGCDGWIILEHVYATGDDQEDEARLRRAEADWIHRRNPVHNVVRPIRPNGYRPPARSAVYRSAIAPRRQRKRRFNPKPLLLFILAAVATVLAARVIVAMHLPWDAAPWIGAPVIGLAVAWFVLQRLRKMWRSIAK